MRYMYKPKPGACVTELSVSASIRWDRHKRQRNKAHDSNMHFKHRILGRLTILTFISRHDKFQITQ